MFNIFLPKCCRPYKHLYIDNITTNTNVTQTLSDKVVEIHLNFEHIIDIIKNNEYIHTFKCIKSYDLNGLGVFYYKQYIIRIDSIDNDVCKNEQTIMSILETGINKNINIVLPYLVESINEKVIISIQPFIENSVTFDKWVDTNYYSCHNHKILIPIFIKMCKLLRHLHLHNIVHGDIKPTNILIQYPSNEPYLIDFGMSGIANERIGTGGTGVFCHPSTGNNKACCDEEYKWHTNQFEYDIWSIGFMFLTIIQYKKCLQNVNVIPPPLLFDDGYINFSHVKLNSTITNFRIIEILEYILHKTPSWKTIDDIIEKLEIYVREC